mmetsp:Transcript_32211/g.102541  ORF Transcript_32211/g.102541 Transcript_32211/m.102541 type:complete len:107 (+) Transcript_32211:2247-2567(+)
MRSTLDAAPKLMEVACDGRVDSRQNRQQKSSISSPPRLVIGHSLKCTTRKSHAADVVLLLNRSFERFHAHSSHQTKELLRPIGDRMQIALGGMRLRQPGLGLPPLL